MQGAGDTANGCILATVLGFALLVDSGVFVQQMRFGDAPWWGIAGLIAIAAAFCGFLYHVKAGSDAILSVLVIVLIAALFDDLLIFGAQQPWLGVAGLIALATPCYIAYRVQSGRPYTLSAEQLRAIDERQRWECTADPLAVRDVRDPIASQRPFLGWLSKYRPEVIGARVMAMADTGDSIAIVGTTQVGKTGGVIIPQARRWGGALVSTSTKPDVLRATYDHRLRLAKQHGGQMYVYAPTEAGAVERVRPMRWSPLAGCCDPTVVDLRVRTILEASPAGRGVQDPTHWRSGAGRILAPYFHAAANHPSRPGDFTLITQWLDAEEFDEPLAILSNLGTRAANRFVEQLAHVQSRRHREEVQSFFEAAQTAIDWSNNPTVLQSCEATDLDPEKFLLTRSTLYVVSPTEHQKTVAPLIAALIQSIVDAAYDLHRRGRLPASVLLSLDEVANIAPLPSLESIISQGGSQGVLVTWAAQSLAQVRHKYGEHLTQAIWSASRAKLVFGGLADDPLLDALSKLLGGHHRTYSTSGVSSKKPFSDPFKDKDAAWTTSWTTGEWEPWMRPHDLYSIPRGHAILLWVGDNRPRYPAMSAHQAIQYVDVIPEEGFQ